MSVYSFTAQNISVFDSSDATILIQLQKQSISSWNAALPSLDWTSGHIDSRYNVFSSPVIDSGGDGDAGELLVTSFSMEAINRPFFNDTRLSDVLTYDPYNEVIHCRVGYSLNPATHAFTWAYGIVNYGSILYSMTDYSNRDTWLISFDVADLLTSLSNLSVSGWMDNHFKHIEYDVSASDVFLSYLQGTAAGYFGQGEVKVDSMLRYWADDSTDPNNDWYSADLFRFVRIVDLYTALSKSLGLELQVNAGQAWSAMVSTRWFWNNEKYSGTDAITLFEGYFNHLYVMSGFFINNNYWSNEWTFFDYNKLSKASFIQYGSVLEMFKFISVSLGLEMSIKMNNSGRYLEVKEKGKSYESLTGSIDSARIGESIELTPYPESVDGILVKTAFDDEYTLGSIANNYINLDCLFASGQNIVRKHVHFGTYDNDNVGLKGYGFVDTSTSPYQVRIDRGDKEIYQTLWISTDEPQTHSNTNPGAASAISEIHTVCATVPRRNFVTMPDSAKGNRGYLFLGSYQTTLATKDIYGMMFPRYNYSGESDWSWDHALWLASYYYSIVGYADDPIGLQRRYSREIAIKYKGILQIDVGQELYFDIAGGATKWRLISKSIDLKSFTSTFRLLSLNSTL